MNGVEGVFPDMFPDTDTHVCRLGRLGGLRALNPYSIDVYLCQESLKNMLLRSELHEMQIQCQKTR